MSIGPRETQTPIMPLEKAATREVPEVVEAEDGEAVGADVVMVEAVVAMQVGGLLIQAFIVSKTGVPLPESSKCKYSRLGVRNAILRQWRYLMILPPHSPSQRDHAMEIVMARRPNHKHLYKGQEDNLVGDP